ncbi:ABC transporter substrate-binding protein [Psychrilyobacter sp.]|uniref:ABC transporter substrate-binding protein n=1 Tax=Psychrilyobacter sp. TaxID=2586924 RepID=UPI00301B176B
MIRNKMKIIALLGLVISINSFSIDVYTPKAPPSIPMLTMKDGVTLHYYQDAHTEIIPRIIKDQDGVYIIPTNLGENLKKKGLELKLLGVTSQGLISIISQKNIEDIRDLDGENILIGSQGSSPDVISKFLFRKNNITPKITYRSTPEVAKLMILQRGDNAVLPEPMATMVLEKNSKLIRTIVYIDEWEKVTSLSGIPQVGLYTTQKYSKTHSKEIEKFITEYKKNLKDLKKDPNEFIDLAQVNFNINLSKKGYEESIEYMNLTLIDGEEGDKLVKEYIEILGENR